MSADNNNQNNTIQEDCFTLSEIVDDIAPKITDGQYLKLQNTIKKIFDTLSNGHTTRLEIVYIREYIEREPRPRRQYEKKVIMTTQEKIDAGYKHCRFCDSYVTPKHFAQHQRTDKCKSITLIKKLSSEEGKVFTDQSKMSELEQRDIDEVKQEIEQLESPDEDEGDDKPKPKPKKEKKPKVKKEKKPKVKKPSVASSMNDPPADPDSDDEPIQPRRK